MKERKTLISVVILAALLLTLMAGCGTQSSKNGKITVTDMMGREVSLDAPASKIVVLTAAECEILYALGAGDSVVGKGEYCDWPAEAADVPVVNSGFQTNVEQIIALEPDLVIMNSMDQSPEDVTKLEEAGIPVAVTLAADISGVYESITLIGTLTGQNKAADLIVKSMKKVFDDISAAPAGDGEQTVYFEVSPLQWGLWTAGKGTFMDEVAALVGLKNCFGDVDGWAEISEEQVLERNPDFIVTISMYYGEGPTPVEEILSRPGWENLTAVKNGSILNLQDNELTRPGPRLVDGTVMLNDFVAEQNALDDAA
ncbi:MAG: ABC transporter substrate-binding protein [Oscillospiraceae bacterium]|nr:ABC transporter substrate-binding protein [Oscillospiraceae bacterium]